MTKVEAIQNLRRSNAAQPIPNRKVRKQNTRGDRNRAAIRED